MENLKVIIAGGGTSGLATAIELSKIGYTVTLLEAENEEEYNKKHNWSDAVDLEMLKAAGFDMPKGEGNKFIGKLVKTYPEGKGLFEPHRIDPLEIFDAEYNCKAKTPVRFDYIETDRQVLREMQLQQAKDLGVSILFDAPALELLGETSGGLGEISIQGVKAFVEGEEINLFADLVVDASGSHSKLRTQLSAPEISTPFAKDDFNHAYRTVRHYNEDTPRTETFCDHYRYPAFKGYFWIQFQADGIVDIGGGLPANGDVRTEDIVNEMVASYPQISGNEIRGGTGLVHVGMPPDAIVATGFVVIGESAAQVNPSNGCGVGGAINAAQILAGVLKKAQSVNISELWEYAHTWFMVKGADYAALLSTNKLITGFTHEEMKVLTERNIMGGDTLNYNINGIFPPTSPSTLLRALGLRLNHKDILSALLKSSRSGKVAHKHYLDYPEKWNQATLTKWIQGKP